MRRDTEHPIFNSIVFTVSYIMPVACMLGIGYEAFMVTTAKHSPTMAVIICAVLICVIKLMKPIRAEYRQRVEMSDPYRSPSNIYKTRSKEERDILDMITYKENEAALSEKEFRGMVHSAPKDPDHELQKLTGLPNVKKQVAEMKATMAYRGKKEKPNYNCAFLGDPGTGKTTVAGIIAAYLYKYRILKKNEFVVTDGPSLVTGNDPVRRISLLLNRSKGRLLFIDEAYAIAYAPGAGSMVATAILNEMESDREHTFIVFAGYKKEMKALFNMNPGFESRIANVLFFENYTMNEMIEITRSMAAARGFAVSDEACDVMEDVYTLQAEYGVFANARSARNLCEDAIKRHRLRLMEKRTSRKSVIEPEDIEIPEARMQYFSPGSEL